ncbi:MAG: transposase, partial [Ruminococcus sp.]|nr:transposase [Ruminococcus sp.]
MYLTVKQQVKHLSKEEYNILRELCHTAKNLANEAIYHVRQYYFTEGEYLNYEKNYALLKDSQNYKMLNSNMAQQILKEVDGSFKSFFGLLKLAKKGKYAFRDCKLPHYLPKDGFATLVIGFVRLNENKLVLPYSNTFRKTHKPVEIKIPPILNDKKIKEIRIIPKSGARFFEIQYTYKAECIQRNLNPQNALALDLGVNNLVTAVSGEGRSFIIDGKRLKSVNQWFNKENARLQSIKDKQGDKKRTINRQKILADKRNRQVNDYMSKTAKMIINYCIRHDIGTLVIGYNETFQRNSDIGKQNNQNFVNIPYGKLRSKLKYLCELNSIVFVKQEESYTSKASFWDGDTIPIYNADNPQKYHFNGKRVKRGLYRTANGKLLNADINGALNI